MTISPQPPNLVPIEGKEKFKRLAEDHLTYVKVGFGYSLKVLIKAGFETDGASIPDNLLEDKEYGEKIKSYIACKYPRINTRWDFENLVKYLVGTPWDLPRLLAAIVHDALYGRKWKFRWLCDRVYKWILEENNYDPIRIDIEYTGIRLLGWRNWKEVSDWEIVTVKRLTEVEFVRTKMISATSTPQK